MKLAKQAGGMIKKDFIGNSVAIPLLFFLLAPFLLYLPVLHKYFVSDDFKVLNRVCLQEIIFVKGFFRPLSDITIYLNYRIGGLDPLIFNSFNLLVHGINSLLLYQFCLRLRISADNRLNRQFAFLAGTLFLTYPFHNEAVVWLLGRGASMSCSFALAGLLFLFSHYNLSKRILLTCSCYFIGLFAFESIIFYPFIILIFIFIKGGSRKEKTAWLSGLLLTLCIHLTLRILISGSVTGNYGGGFAKANPVVYMLNIIKTAGRLIFPPSGEAHWLVLVYIAILIPAGWLGIQLIRKAMNPPLNVVKGLILCLCIACIVPVFTGISTITSESDRMLYFPSLFLCMIVSVLLIFFIRNRSKKLLIFFLLLSYNIFLLETNNFHWAIAGKTTESLVSLLKNKTSGKTYVLDIPEEYRGAYIFRQGLSDALRINSINPARVVVINFLTRDQANLPQTPMVRQRRYALNLNKDDNVIFWDGHSFVRLNHKVEK